MTQPRITLWQRTPEGKNGWFPVRYLNADFCTVETAQHIALHLSYALSCDIKIEDRDGADVGVVFLTEATEYGRALAAQEPPLEENRLQEIRRRRSWMPDGVWIGNYTNSYGHKYRMYEVPGVAEWSGNATGGMQDFYAHAGEDIAFLLVEVDRLKAELAAEKAAKESGPSAA